MRTLTIVAAALLVVLAGYGIVDAAVVTLSIVPAATQLSADGLNGPASTTFTVFATVTGNTTNDGYMDLYGGLSQFVIDQSYTVGGVITEGKLGHRVAAGPLTQTNAATSIVAPFNAVMAPGKLVTAAWVPSHTGTGGVDETGGAKALIGDKYDYYTSALPYQLGNLDASGGVKVALYTGTIDAKTSTDTTVYVNALGQSGMILVYRINALGLYTAVPEQVINGSAMIHLGPAVVTNTAPVMDSVSPNPVLETTWTQEPGWNNPAHTVVMTATAHDADNNPLTFIWTMTNPNPSGTSHQLTGAGAVFNLTIAELLAKFPGELPATKGIPGYLYDWDLAVQAYDGTVVSSNTIHVPVFVPEPATIGLLSFGIVGALLRRRRRA